VELRSKKPDAKSESLDRFFEKVKREADVERGFSKDSRGSFLVKYDDQKFRGVGTSLLEMLDQISSRLSARLGLPLPGRLTLVLYTRQDYQSATLAHGWTGALFDGKIRLPVKNFATASSVIEATLAHEMTHWFVGHWAQHCPTWLNEGLAQFLENPTAPRLNPPLLRAAKAKGELRSVADLPDSWATESDASKISLYYAQSLSFCHFLSTSFGEDSLRELLSQFSEKRVLKDVFPSVYGRPLTDLEADWARDF
jgi:hypothetical protein